MPQQTSQLPDVSSDVVLDATLGEAGSDVLADPDAALRGDVVGDVHVRDTSSDGASTDVLRPDDVGTNRSGTLDPNFNTTGFVTSGLLGRDVGRAVLVQQVGAEMVLAGGKFGPAGGTDFLLLRYDSVGRLDTTFAATATTPGVLTFGFGANTADEGKSLVLAPDGDILFAGIVLKATTDASASHASTPTEPSIRPSMASVTTSQTWPGQRRGQVSGFAKLR